MKYLDKDKFQQEDDNKLLDNRTCPLCGKDNGCTHNKDCWCFSTTIPKELLNMIPEDKKGKACICKSCVGKYKATLDINN